MNDWFWARAMAAEGDLTVSHLVLNAIAAKVVEEQGQDEIEEYCRMYGVKYFHLLPEEQEYLKRQILTEETKGQYDTKRKLW